MFGEDFIEIKLVGDSFEECAAAAIEIYKENNQTFIPPYDNLKIIEGQATVGWKYWKNLPILIIYFYLLAVEDSHQALVLILKLFHPLQK